MRQLVPMNENFPMSAAVRFCLCQQQRITKQRLLPKQRSFIHLLTPPPHRPSPSADCPYALVTLKANPMPVNMRFQILLFTNCALHHADTYNDLFKNFFIAKGIHPPCAQIKNKTEA